MQRTKINPSAPIYQTGRFFLVLASLTAILVLGVSIFSIYRTPRAQSASHGNLIISQQLLEEQYGLKVNLVALTAAGGMLDVRLSITDAQKAEKLLSDPPNFPTLLANNGLLIKASQDVASEEIKFVNGNNIFILYPNVRNSFSEGDTVSIVFGNIQLEAIDVR